MHPTNKKMNTFKPEDLGIHNLRVTVSLKIMDPTILSALTAHHSNFMVMQRNFVTAWG